MTTYNRDHQPYPGIRDPHDPLMVLPYHRSLAASEIRTARREGWEPATFVQPYKTKRAFAYRPVLGQLRMIESAIRCDLACRDAVMAWRVAA